MFSVFIIVLTFIMNLFNLFFIVVVSICFLTQSHYIYYVDLAGLELTMKTEVISNTLRSLFLAKRWYQKLTTACLNLFCLLFMSYITLSKYFCKEIKFPSQKSSGKIVRAREMGSWLWNYLLDMVKKLLLIPLVKKKTTIYGNLKPNLK